MQQHSFKLETQVLQADIPHVCDCSVSECVWWLFCDCDVKEPDYCDPEYI